MNADAPRRLQPEDLWSLRFVGDPQVSPDGSQVAFVVTGMDKENDGYISSVWLAETDDPTSARPLTNPPGDSLVRETMPRWSPDGAKLAFASNREGPNHLWIIDPSGGEAKKISDHTGNYAGLGWSPTGDALTFTASPPSEGKDEPGPSVYVTNRLRYKFNGRGLMTDSRRNAIWSMDVDSGDARRLTEAWWDDANPVYSPDAEYIYFVSDRYPEEDMYYVTDLYRVPVAGGDAEKVTDGEGPVASPVFSPDGQTVAFVGHAQGDDTTANMQLMYMSADGGSRQSLTAGMDRSVGCSVGSDARFDGGSGEPRWIADGKELLFNLTDGGQCHLYRVSQDSSPRPLSGFPPVITSFSAGPGEAPTIAAVAADWNTPGDLWVMDESGEVKQFTDLNGELLDSVSLSRPRPVTYSGAEDWPMEGWIMEPVEREPGRKYPLVLEIHGGPASTSGDCFFFEYQLLAASGWGVMY
ncbi:MAG: S9 family peptidase, partial [Clostridia bacterium]